MQYTFAQLQGLVRTEVQANVNITETATLIKDSINLAIFDIVRETPWPELLKKATVALTGASSGTALILPTDFLAIERLRFIDASTGKEWKLFERTGLIPPAKVEGLPSCYVLLQDTVNTAKAVAVSIEPYALIDNAADSLVAWYYSYPALLSADGDIAKSNMWDAEIVRRACSRYYIKDNKLEQSKAILARMAQAQTALQT